MPIKIFLLCLLLIAMPVVGQAQFIGIRIGIPQLRYSKGGGSPPAGGLTFLGQTLTFKGATLTFNP